MKRYQNRKLLGLAKGMPCQFRILGVCGGDKRTTVACHANWQQFGKGKGVKANDWAMAHGCVRCHAWLDSGPASNAKKHATFLPAALKTYAALVEQGRLRLTAGHALPGGRYADLDAPYQPAPKEETENLVAALGEIEQMLASGLLYLA